MSSDESFSNLMLRTVDPIYWTPDRRQRGCLILLKKDKILQIRPPAALSDVMPLRNMLGKKKKHTGYFINEKGRCVFLPSGSFKKD